DAVGAVILYKAGYDPQAMADFFRTLQEEGGKTPPQILSDHPNPGNRQEAIEKELSNWPKKDYTRDSPAFQSTRQHAMGVKAYTGEEIAQGAKAGQWTKLNKENGAVFNPGAGNSFSANAAARRSGVNVRPVALESVLPSPTMVAASVGPIKMN